MIQLLPESNGTRDCIVSVRSHEFAPEVTFINRCSELGELNPVSYTHLRAHETVLDLVCRLLLEKTQKKQKKKNITHHIYRKMS